VWHGEHGRGRERRYGTIEDRLEDECDELRTCKTDGHGEGWSMAGTSVEGAGKGRGWMPNKEGLKAASISSCIVAPC
jgi:hypothetical protein